MILIPPVSRVFMAFMSSGVAVESNKLAFLLHLDWWWKGGVMFHTFVVGASKQKYQPMVIMTLGWNFRLTN